MRATAGGSAFPAYKLLYSNEGDTLVGTRTPSGDVGVAWSTDGESILCEVGSDGQYKSLILTEGLFGHCFRFEFQLKFPDDGTEGYGFQLLGMGLGNSADLYSTNESNTLDITVSGADTNFGQYSVWLQLNAKLETPAFDPGEWVSVAYEVIGGMVGVWIDTVWIGAFSAVRTGYDSGTGGIYNCAKICNSRTRRGDHKPARIKKIRVYQMDIGEFE